MGLGVCRGDPSFPSIPPWRTHPPAWLLSLCSHPAPHHLRPCPTALRSPVPPPAPVVQGQGDVTRFCSGTGHRWRCHRRSWACRAPTVRQLCPRGSPMVLRLVVPAWTATHGVCARCRGTSRDVFEDLETCPQLWMSLHLARLCSLAVCGSNGTSFEDDLTLGAEGTNHLRARWGVPSCGVTVTPRAELTQRRPGSWGQAGADPEGTVPKLCIPWGSGLWLQGRTSPRVASVGPVPKTPRLTPCRLSAPFSQLFCYRGATRPRAGEV